MNNMNTSPNMDGLKYIEQLIYDFYNSSDGHSVANKQLTYYQVSKESWDFSWMLLQPGKAIEVQYFGASCLHMKISKYWTELDDDKKIMDLRAKLLDTMRKYMIDSKLKIVQTKLCVALASYIVHSITKYWPTAICDLIESFNPAELPDIPPNKIVNTLINILNVIPEEFNTNFLSMVERNQIRNALISSVNPVFSVIKSILEQQTLDLYDVKQLAIKCFSNWSQNLGTLIIEGDLYERNLILILSAMSDEELISYCSETLILIYSQHEIHKYPNTVLKFIVQIVKLEDLLNDAIKKQQSTIYSALYNLFIHIGETHSRLILDAILTKEEYRDSILKLITFVLQCSATDGYYPVDETCSEQAFNFWYTLQDDIVSSEQDKVASYLTLFNPLYQTLMDTLIKKVQYPPDQIYEHEWTNEDKESFRCYRQDIGDTFMYCYNMLRNSMLSILMNHFNLSVMQLSNNLQYQQQSNHLLNHHQLSNDKPWQHLEAVIFAFTSISENIDATENIHINNLFESLAQIPLAQIAAPRLTASIMEMFGAYYEWIYNHPEFLPKVLTLLVLGLKSDHIAVVSATMALKDITRECQTLILPYANQLLIACEECLRPDSNLKPKEKSRLMCTIGQVLSITPIDVTMNYLNIILPPLLQGLSIDQQHDNNLVSLSSFSQKNNILHHISMLTMLFTTLDPELKQSDPEDGGSDLINRYKSKSMNGNSKQFQTPHPTLPIFQEVLPRLIQIASKYINEESIIEAFSDCVKKALFNLLDHAKPLIMDILRVLHEVYSQSYQPSLLDVLKLIMILYWDDLDLRPILAQLYKQICNQTVNYCRQDAKQKSSLIEYFFTNAHLIMRKIPTIYRENSSQDNADLQSMFNLASNALELAEKPTVRSVSTFLNEFLTKSIVPENHNLLVIVNNEGQHLLNQIFIVIGVCHDSSKFNIEFMADLLLSLNHHHFENFCRWLMIVFTQQEAFPTDKINKSQKEYFTKLLIRECKSKRKLREVLSELSLVARGFNNQELMFPHF